MAFWNSEWCCELLVVDEQEIGQLSLTWVLSNYMQLLDFLEFSAATWLKLDMLCILLWLLKKWGWWKGSIFRIWSSHRVVEVLIYHLSPRFALVVARGLDCLGFGASEPGKDFRSCFGEVGLLKTTVITPIQAPHNNSIQFLLMAVKPSKRGETWANSWIGKIMDNRCSKPICDQSKARICTLAMFGRLGCQQMAIAGPEPWHQWYCRRRFPHTFLPHVSLGNGHMLVKVWDAAHICIQYHLKKTKLIDLQHQFASILQRWRQCPTCKQNYVDHVCLGLRFVLEQSNVSPEWVADLFLKYRETWLYHIVPLSKSNISKKHVPTKALNKYLYKWFSLIFS